VKTGRLLKFHRPAAIVQAYLYQEAGQCRASVYVQDPQRPPDDEPSASFSGASDAAVQAQVRAWVDTHYPRGD
jgi:hypothetical protein